MGSRRATSEDVLSYRVERTALSVAPLTGTLERSARKAIASESAVLVM